MSSATPTPVRATACSSSACAGGLIQNLVAYDNRNGLYASGVGNLIVQGYTGQTNGARLLQPQRRLRPGQQHHLPLDRVTAYGNAGQGIYINSTATITNAKSFDNIGTGIYAENSRASTLSIAQVYDNDSGIIMRGGGSVSDSQVYGNVNFGIYTANAAPTLLRNTIYSNDYGVYSENNGGTLTLTNNLIYNDRTAAIRLIDSRPVFEIVNNTIFEPTADAIYATADDVHLRNNIIWTQAGYGVRIADDKQAGFTSDYNLLYATGAGKIGYWQGDRATLSDWQFANFRDPNSVSADPRFVDADAP